jgi:glycogen debranching enzyme-like protein
VEYNLLQAPTGVEPILEVRTLIAFRGYHSTTHENDSLNASVETVPNLVKVRPYSSLPPLFFAHDAENVADQGFWYKNFLYRVELERGLDFIKDLFNPFVLSWSLTKKRGATEKPSCRVPSQ